MTNQEKKQRAFSQFESGDYRGAFQSFVDLFQDSSDKQEREMIFQILSEGFYEPNLESMQEQYKENCGLLEAYPYRFGFQARRLEDWPVQLFPVTETEYCLYNKEEQTFSELCEITSSELRDYLFRDLSQPLFRENDCNLYHLQYLWDNVRRSEDFGGDNHIYLYYETMEDVFPLLVFGELKPLLADQKFVFLVGRKNKKRYPVDFKKQFQIDYDVMGPQPIRIEEMKRICFWHKKSHAGTSFSLRVLGAVSGIQSIMSSFNSSSFLRNEGRLCYTEEFKQIMSDVNHSYTAEELEAIEQSPQYSLILDVFTEEQYAETILAGYRSNGGNREYFTWLRNHYEPSHQYTIHDLFCAYFLWQYEKRNLNPRVPPLILYDPHMWDPSVYSGLILSFPYYACLTSVREPIMLFARNYDSGGVIGTQQFPTQYELSSDYCYAQFLHEKLRECYYGFRFEDLKTKPEAVCRAACRHLNVPYESQMLETDSPMPDMNNGGKITRGFDTAALHRDISMYLSEFDQLRLKMFYAPILDYYGYPSFSFKEHPLTESIVRELLKYPFRFEYVNQQRYNNPPSWDELHRWIQEVLQGALGKQFTAPKMIPLEEPQNE